MISKHPLGGNLWDAQYRLYPSTLSATLSVIVGVNFHAYNQAGQTCLLHQDYPTLVSHSFSLL